MRTSLIVVAGTLVDVQIVVVVVEERKMWAWEWVD